MKKWIITVFFASVLLVASERSEDIMHQQRQDLFQKHKALEEKTHQERMKILQEADECVKHAVTSQAYRECERHEQESKVEFKKHYHPQKEALRHEKEILKEKSKEMRVEKMQKSYPQGTIATH